MFFFNNSSDCIVYFFYQDPNKTVGNVEEKVN